MINNHRHQISIFLASLTSITVLGSHARAAVINVPLTGIADFSLHDLYTNGIDLRPPAGGTEGLLLPIYPGAIGPGGRTGLDTWNFTIQNTGTVAWDDFKVSIRANVAAAALGVGITSTVDPVPSVTAGFGATPAAPIPFVIGPLFNVPTGLSKTANLPAASTIAVVPPGGTATFQVNVGCIAGTPAGCNYHLGVQPTPVVAAGGAVPGQAVPRVGNKVPPPQKVPGKEYTDKPDENAGDESLDASQNLAWDGNGNVQDSFDYDNVDSPMGPQIDALANVQDALFQEVVNNEVAILFSTEGSPFILFETIDGEIDVWAEPPQINSDGVRDVDALEIWGPEPGINNVEEADDANLFSEEEETVSVNSSGASVFAFDPSTGSKTIYLTNFDIASAIGPSDLTSPAFQTLLDNINLDAMMVLDEEGDNFFENGDKILFSIEPIPELGLVGDEVWVWDGETPATFLDHGGHLWNSGWLGSNINALEAVADPIPVPEPTSNLSILALGALSTALTLKGQLKSSKSPEKETEKVS